MENSTQKFINHYYAIINFTMGKTMSNKFTFYSGDFSKKKEIFKVLDDKTKIIALEQLDRIQDILCNKGFNFRNNQGYDLKLLDSLSVIEETKSSISYFEFFVFPNRIEIFDLDISAFGEVFKSGSLDEEMDSFRDKAAFLSFSICAQD